MTVFIGNNSSGKTAALDALNLMFSPFPSDRILKRTDFHLPKEVKVEEQLEQNLSIEAVFDFDELEGDKDPAKLDAVPIWFKSMYVGGEGEAPILRIRLEANWCKSNNAEGAIESTIYCINCAESEPIEDCHKRRIERKYLDYIRVLYIPAVRDPAKELKNVSGTILNQLFRTINWTDESKDKIQGLIAELNQAFDSQEGIANVRTSIEDNWKNYDPDKRFENAKLLFSSTDIASAMKNSTIVFSPGYQEKESTINEIGDGLRSLFYISLMHSVLGVEDKIRSEKGNSDTTFSYVPPLLTVIALEEPENHIAPHLLGRLMNKIMAIAGKSEAQVIVSSHSPSIVKRVDPRKLRYFRLDLVTWCTDVKVIRLPNEEKQTEQFKYIKEAVAAYPELYFAKFVILGEGDSEELVIPKMWEASHGSIDLSCISVVPLGGRHVNHFWRLLNNLKIPFITLLDLDKEREGGGWGRIYYAAQQLTQYETSLDDFQIETKNDLKISDFANMPHWDDNDSTLMEEWIKVLEAFGVYYSKPLDLDFLMLEAYTDVYINTCSEKEGPVIESENKKRMFVKDFDSSLHDDYCDAYQNKVNGSVRNTLKKHGGTGELYTNEQRELMIWYDYFFLGRGKPITHLAALSKMSTEELKESMPEVIVKMLGKVDSILSEVQNDTDKQGTLDTN